MLAQAVGGGALGAIGGLVDRGGRELPIQADVIGTTVSLTATDRVDVLLSERDGRDVVELVRASAE